MNIPSSDAGEQDFDVAGLCRNFSELSPQPMVAVEGETHIVRYLNPAFASLAGVKHADMIGRPFADAIPEGAANGCLALLDRVYRTGTPETLAEQEHAQSPQTCWSYSMWAILGKLQRPMGVVIQVTDATEIATFRKQSVAMNQQLLVSGISQHELTESAEAANRTKDEFLATLSHELRTPLSVIVGWTEILQGPELEQELLVRGLEVISRNARSQSLLIDDLLDVSRIVSGKLRLNMRPADLESIIATAIDSLSPSAGDKGLTLQLQSEGAFQVMADSDRLHQVAWNLISNAIKFTPQGGQIWVRLARVESSVELTITDTGKGIAPEFLPHVFERFQQADSTTSRSSGSIGLGLAIVHHLVELHAGTVRVSSEGEGQGATFTVSLPLMSTPSG